MIFYFILFYLFPQAATFEVFDEHDLVSCQIKNLKVTNLTVNEKSLLTGADRAVLNNRTLT
jgi:hypothetical protein